MVYYAARRHNDDRCNMEMTRQECLNAQKEYCKRTGAPHFAPYDGVCNYCKKDIVVGYEGRWSSLITGCPRCHHSFCD
jgi:hypothetical protein